jgi:hydrogenase small subunit
MINMQSIKITRRQFLKWLSASAAAIGMSQADLLKLQNAFAAGPIPDPNMPLGTLARVVWITGQDCGGCATTILNFLANPADTDPVLNAVANVPIPAYLTDIDAFYPQGPDGDIDIAEVVLEIVTIEWAYIVMAASGDVANDYLLNTVVPAGNFVLMMDGSIPTAGNGKYCQIMDVKGDITLRPDWPSSATPYVSTYTTTDETNNVPAGQTRTEVTMAAASLWLAHNALAVVSMGTCNSWGGVPAAKGAVTGAKSGYEWINQINGMDKLIVNVPGCAPNPDWFVASVAAAVVEIHASILHTPGYEGYAGILFNNLNTDTDHKGRPKNTYMPMYHDLDYVMCQDCPRISSKPGPDTLLAAQKNSSQSEGQCLELKGCNGYIAANSHVLPDCPTRKWNPFEDHSKNNWCVGNNMPCQGCASPGFPDYCSPFYERTKGIWRGYSYTS